MVNPLLHMISNHTKQNFAEFQCYVKLANLAKTLIFTWILQGFHDVH